MSEERKQLTEKMLNGIQFAEAEFKTFGDEYEIAEDGTISSSDLAKLLKAYEGEIGACQNMEFDLTATYERLQQLAEV